MQHLSISDFKAVLLFDMIFSPIAYASLPMNNGSVYF